MNTRKAARVLQRNKAKKSCKIPATLFILQTQFKLVGNSDYSEISFPKYFCEIAESVLIFFAMEKVSSFSIAKNAVSQWNEKRQ